MYYVKDSLMSSRNILITAEHLNLKINLTINNVYDFLKARLNKETMIWTINTIGVN